MKIISSSNSLRCLNLILEKGLPNVKTIWIREWWGKRNRVQGFHIHPHWYLLGLHVTPAPGHTHVVAIFPVLQTQGHPGQLSHKTSYILLWLIDIFSLLLLWVSCKGAAAKVFLFRWSMKPFLCYCPFSVLGVWVCERGDGCRARDSGFCWLLRHYLDCEAHSPFLSDTSIQGLYHV